MRRRWTIYRNGEPIFTTQRCAYRTVRRWVQNLRTAFPHNTYELHPAFKEERA